MNNPNKAIVGAGITVLIAGSAFAYSFVGNDSCGKDEVELRVSAGYQSKNVCMAKGEYKAAKDYLKAQFNDKEKNYEFNINDRLLLGAVLDKEIKEKGLSISGKITKDTLRQELINLLN